MAAHQKFRSIQIQIPGVLREFLNIEDIAILTRYGAWLQALTKGDIPPTTLAQVQFLKVADGWLTPKSSHETAWTALVYAKNKLGGQLQDENFYLHPRPFVRSRISFLNHFEIRCEGGSH